MARTQNHLRDLNRRIDRAQAEIDACRRALAAAEINNPRRHMTCYVDPEWDDACGRSVISDYSRFLARFEG